MPCLSRGDNAIDTMLGLVENNGSVGHWRSVFSRYWHDEEKHTDMFKSKTPVSSNDFL